MSTYRPFSYDHVAREAGLDYKGLPDKDKRTFRSMTGSALRWKKACFSRPCPSNQLLTKASEDLDRAVKRAVKAIRGEQS